MEKSLSTQNNNNEPILIPKSEPQNISEIQTKNIENGYHFPPRYPWDEAMKIILKKCGKFMITPFGFFVTIYGLNIVAWGGMLFLLICNAAPAMCKPTCEDINSSRRKWIEIDSQILNGLFCVTGFGTIPWRVRDLWYLMQYRLLKKDIGLRKLAVIHRGWFRISSTRDTFTAHDDGLTNAREIAFFTPELKAPTPPLTGIHSPPTAVWKLDFVIWSMVWNTIFQVILSGLMWGLNRFDRPGWSTGLFITLGCIVGGMGGLVSFLEAKKVKSIEGVEVTQQDLAKLARDEENGIVHYNNIKDRKPK
ncbi:hypothetical protein EPUL_001244 [Erysiphe pulchra]|uniref:Uncharacterized protein n=1 Tax=Erysiphe pulchra TaxID=225359 RepID=A0A2S4Q198_9PEZI|nr:hypothetical protein EPUL_001244 [Erysiphe pulchra]